MQTVTFNLTAGENGKSVTVYLDDAFTITDDNPSWDEVYDLLVTNDDFTDEEIERLEFLLSPQVALDTAFRLVSEQVSIRGGKVYFDGETISNAIADYLIDAYKDGNEIALTSMAKFMENLQANPNPHSRDHLFRWMKNRSFHITPEGYILAYKGVHSNGIGNRISSSTGFGIVNGKVFENANLPNNDGDVVEMPRSKVTFDPKVGCSVGLHVGTYKYARGFASILIAVKVNPRDVVSVPSDSNDEKMRVRLYEVLGEPTGREDKMFCTETDLVPHWKPQERTVEFVPVQESLDISEPKKSVKKATKKAAKKVAKKATKKVAKRKPAKYKGLGVSDVVELAKFSTTWVKGHAVELGGVKNPETKQWEFGNKTMVKAALKKLNALK